MKLVPDARDAWRWWSVRAMVAAGALQAAWVAIPDDLRVQVPDSLTTALTGALMVLGVLGRLVDQK